MYWVSENQISITKMGPNFHIRAKGADPPHLYGQPGCKTSVFLTTSHGISSIFGYPWNITVHMRWAEGRWLQNWAYKSQTNFFIGRTTKLTKSDLFEKHPLPENYQRELLSGTVHSGLRISQRGPPIQIGTRAIINIEGLFLVWHS